MVFNSLLFAVFFIGVLILYHAPLSWRIRKLILLLASYLFYAAWNPPFVLLLWLSTIVDWKIGQRLGSEDRVAIRRLLLAGSLSVNLGLLAVFKYGEFLVENFAAALGSFGVIYQPPEMSIVLPVGISFYTFQTLSYTIDLYQRRSKPWHSFLDFALFVTFFPQLVAGPIVRASSFLPQCVQPRTATKQQLGWGLLLFVVGLFQKVVLSDAIFAPIAEAVFDSSGAVSFAVAWSGALAFTGQIYCDFAGYSSCAIGAALCLGFQLPRNFQAPYASIGFSDFWQRWHISLSTWLRDYVYIPLGGNQRGAVRTVINLMATMLLGGLWHGASWTFVIWGGLHGLFLVVERLLKVSPMARASVWRKNSGRCTLAALTFTLVVFTWVFFRSDSFDRAFEICAAMLGLATESSVVALNSTDAALSFLAICLLLAVHWALRDQSLEEAISRIPWYVVSTSMAVALLLIMTSPGEDRAFIYFQF